ncbi:MAG: tyrosine-type recombinase/integrase [Maritimibacter sp.]|nr:tyrosine-type recombinase/integrase [Maritimibacter sp.]
MGQIITRVRKDGSPSYTAQVRRKKGGKTVYNATQTFDRKSDAKAWMKRKERELNKPDGLETVVAKTKEKTLGQVIQAYIDSQAQIGKSKLQNLKATCRFPIAEEPVTQLTASDFLNFARDLLKGEQPAPIDPTTAPDDYYELAPRLPQTVGGYMSHLGVVIQHAGPLVGQKLPIAEFLEAMSSCRHLGIVGPSGKRKRRPTLEELNKLMDYFFKFSEADPRAVPMHMVILAAIFLTYRQAEHTRLLWSDVEDAFADHDPTLLIRGMKHPRIKGGLDVTVQVRIEGLAVIRAMPEVSDRIFPYHPDTISRRFTEACKLLGIEDLHFHDLRHEGISRLFEMGLSIPDVVSVTGHQHWPTLQRYTHVKKVGDKFARWPWLSLIGL